MGTKKWQAGLRLLIAFSIFTASCGLVSNSTPTPTIQATIPSTPATAGIPPDPNSNPTTAPVATSSTSSNNNQTTTATPIPSATTVPIENASSATVSVNPDQLPALPQFNPSIPESPTFDQIVQRGSQLQPLLNQLQNELDTTQFDRNDLNASLDFDADSLLQFVQTEIAFEQYPGVLRGVEGTLIGRAGNAIDQALLLRNLLDDAGYETRLARAELSDEQAELLINQMAIPRPAESPIGDSDAIAQIVTQIKQINGTETETETGEQTLHQAVRDMTEEDTALILAALADAGIFLDAQSSEMMEQITQEAKDYFWVQYRFSAFDDWGNAHPVFAEPPADFTDLSPDETFRETPPAELYHRFRLEIFVEQKADDELIVYPILEGWEQTTAELVGQPFTFQNQPNNADWEEVVPLDQLLTDTSIFLTLINGELAQNAFDLDGRAFGAGLVSLDTVGMTELFQSVASGAETASGLIGGLGDDDAETDPESLDDLFTLTAQWIEYTLIAPNGEEEMTRRYVMDRVGEENRTAGIAQIKENAPLLESAKSLLTSYTIMVLPADYNQAYITNRTLQRMSKELELLAYIAPDGSLIEYPEQVVAELVPGQDIMLDNVYQHGVNRNAGIIGYRSAPTVIIHESGIVPDSGGELAFEQVDVIQNERRLFDISNGRPQPVPSEAVRMGVWETMAESVLLPETEVEERGALQAIRGAASAGIPLRVIPPHESATLTTLPHTPETKASVQRDLDAGYVVIIPERPHDDSQLSGWWRVNPRTGETLGIGTGGFGQQYVEYLISLKLGALFAFIGYQNCRAAGGSAGCCLYENAALFAIGLVSGYWIGQIALSAGAAGSTAFGISFLLGDVGINIGGVFNPVSICH